MADPRCPDPDPNLRLVDGRHLDGSATGGRGGDAVRRARTLVVLAMALVALGLAACGGGDGKQTTTNPAPSEAPGAGATRPGGPPPALVRCMAEQGIDVKSLDREALDKVLNNSPEGEECFESLHEGGGAP